MTVDEFMAERFRGILTDEYGVGGDVPNSVIAYLSGPDAQSPACLCGRAVAIRDALADESFRLFLDNVFKRVGNLVRKADEDFPGWRDAAARLADPDLDYSATFADPVEIELEGARVAGMEKCRNAKMNHDYAAVLKLMASFEEPLARFIGTGKDGVPVLLEKDEGKRLARLALLDRIFCQFNWFADFTLFPRGNAMLTRWSSGSQSYVEGDRRRIPGRQGREPGRAQDRPGRSTVTITTDVRFTSRTATHGPGLKEEVEAAIEWLERSTAETGRHGQSAAGVCSVRRFHAGHDGYHPEPGLERYDRRDPCQLDRQPPFRDGQLSPVHQDVRRRRPGIKGKKGEHDPFESR